MLFGEWCEVLKVWTQLLEAVVAEVSVRELTEGYLLYLNETRDETRRDPSYIISYQCGVDYCCKVLARDEALLFMPILSRFCSSGATDIVVNCSTLVDSCFLGSLEFCLIERKTDIADLNTRVDVGWETT